MNNPLPLFNWSLKKALATVPDSFARARMNIIFTILLISLLKIAIVLIVGIQNEQWLQVVRGGVAVVFYIALIKILLYKPARLNLLAHIMIMIGIVVIWSNVFVFAHKINLPTLQFVFMVSMCSFYILGSRLGLIYSIVGIIPVMFTLIFQGSEKIYLTHSPQEFASPGFEMIVILNFLSIIICHYLFYKAFIVTISEKETLNQELHLSVAEANKLAETKSNFLSTISHELRTPLNSVIGIAELLQRDKPDPKQKENLKILHFSALDLLSLINNVLDFNKLDSDKLELENVTFRLAEFMHNICSGLGIKAKDKQLDFILDVDKRLENTYVISDPTRLSQLIYNLVSNAIKFTDKGSITIKLELVKQTEDGANILFSVADTGIGIHPEKHEKIFELFTQAESNITRKYGGTGLGLAIVRQVLGLFDSSIQLESTPGKGSRFFFTIPFTTTVEVEETPAQVVAADLSHLKVLVAEDYDFNRLIIQKQMEMLNLKPVMVENGKLAYEAFLSGDYDAILIDLHMPVMDGYETIKQIRSLTDPLKSKVYTIAFTASVSEQQKISAAGFNDYLYKPVNLEDLNAKLAKVVQRNRKPYA